MNAVRQALALVRREIGCREVVLIAGLACLTCGVDRLSHTAALIVLGLVLLYLAAFWPGPGLVIVRRDLGRRKE